MSDSNTIKISSLNTVPCRLEHSCQFEDHDLNRLYVFLLTEYFLVDKKKYYVSVSEQT